MYKRTFLIVCILSLGNYLFAKDISNYYEQAYEE